MDVNGAGFPPWQNPVGLLFGSMSAQALPPSFFARLLMALVCFFQIVFRPRFAQAVLPAYQARKALPRAALQNKREEKPAPVAKDRVREEPEKTFASALFVLSALQREGRLIDFLQEDIAGATDADVGAAARVVHDGCRKVLRSTSRSSRCSTEAEGAA